MANFFTNGPESEGRNGRRLKATFLLGLMAFLLVSSTLLEPKPAKAQYTDPITSIQTTTTNVWTTIKDAFVEAAVTALVNGVNYFGSQMAYTLAVALTSDCPGQIVCWNSKAFEDGFKQAWQGAIGEAVGTLSQQGGFAKLGFDLCNPSIKFALKIQLGALDEIKPPPPKCDFNALVNNWDNFKDSVSSGEVLKGLKPTFEKGQSGLSIALGAQSGLYEVKEEAKRADIMKRIMDASAGGGFSDVRDPVSGRAKAPSSVTHEQFQAMRKAQQDDPQHFSASAAAGQIASKAVISVVINVVQTFVMTLVSRLLNKLINGLMSTEELIALQPDLILNPEGLLQPPGATGAQEALASRFTAAQPKDAGVIDPLLEFSVCPGSNRGPNNCVIDQQFASAIRVADVTPVTVQQAIDKNMLHGDWPLYPVSNQVKDQDPFCYTYGYCESNLKKLRAARVIPIGWEIAAEKAGPNTTLREIVNGFNNCNLDGVGDSSHPWCHLIDPDWVLKIPPTQCRAMAFGAVPVSSSIPERTEQCVDTQTCLKQDDSGTCVGGWGYCARERNVWRFNGDSCPAAYNTCRTLKSRTGDVRNFILNTIDHGVCNADNAGCRQYGLNLSTVSCSRASNCTDPAGCRCDVILGDTDNNGVTCVISQNKSSCTAADGTVCRQAYPCSSGSCDCTAKLSCTVAKDQRSCSALTGETAAGDDWQLEPARYLNKNAQTCNATDNGCSALLKFGPGESLNLVKNGSFEESEDGDNDGSPDHAKFWTPFADQTSGTAGYIRKDGSRAADGANAVLLPAVATTTAACTVPAGTNVDSNGNCTADLGCPCTYPTAGALQNYTCKVIKGHQKCTVTNAVTQDGLPVTKKVTYTMTATFVPDSGSAVNGKMSLSFRDANGAEVSLAAEDAVSTVTVTGGTASTQTCVVSGGDIVFTVSGTKDDLSKGLVAACTFVVDHKDIQHASISLSATSSGMYADDIQLEEGGGSTYHDGYGGIDQTPVNLKAPPAFLGCTGDEGDRPECASFAGVCRENEVGCDGYSPEDGGAMIPGIAGPRDVCPKECAGYDVFKQEESDFDAVKFPVYFIPDTASQCTQNDVGCSQFTSVETEKIEYYSRLRLCVKPDDPSVGTYYSWEGSDTTGYQLRVWSLKNTMAGAAVTPVAGGTSSDVCADPACLNAGPAPCTSFDANAVNCDSKTLANPAGETDGLCSRAQIDAGNFDCREFYDAAGNRHYRLLSKTIVASGSCTQYRITTSTQVDCNKSNGRWDSGKGQCIYFADASQSRVCAAAQNNCRAYKGNASTNIHSLFNDDFETGIAGWNDSTDTGIANLTQSGESVTVGGHSLKIGGTGAGRDARREVGGLVAPGRSYTLTFWARGTGIVNAGFRDGTQDLTCTIQSACPVSSTNGCGCTTATGLSCLVANDGVSTTCTIPKVGKCLGGSNAGVACASGATCTGGGTCSINPTPTPAKPRSLEFSDDDESAAAPRTSAPRITLTSEWKQFSLGPVIVDAPTDPTLTPWGRVSVKLQLKATGVCVGGTSDGASCTATSGSCPVCAQSDIFIDNVNLKEVQDSIFVVRDSWQIPVSCDTTPDGIPSPQEMLGCRKYTKTSDRAEAYLKSFTNICRDKAIGCAAFSNTQNTPKNPYEESFSAVCRLYDNDGVHGVQPRKCGSLACTQTQCHNASGCSCTRDGKSCTILNNGTTCDIPVPADAGAACVCDYDLRSPAARTDAPQLLSDVCRVAIGETDCRFKLDRWDDSTRIDQHPDRVNVPADKRMYLVGTESAQCSAEAVGCRAMGNPHMSYEDQCVLPPTGTNITNGTCTASGGCTCTLNSTTCSVTQGEKQCKVAYELGIVDKWNAVALKDDPSKYDQTLCSVQTLNCEAYTAADGSYYFKDPVDKVCEFKENVSVNGHSVSGFFRRSASGANFPCYPEYLKDGSYYAMYKNADPICTLPNVSDAHMSAGRCTDDAGCLCAVPPNPVPVCRVFKGNTTCGYQGWVGQCEAKYDRCEEFIDPASTSAAHPDGEPYYYIVNGKLDLKSCAGKASLKSGCVLLKQTSKTENLYSSSATYYRSLSEANSGLVPPVNCDVNPRNSACEQRCVSIPTGVCSETPDKTCVQDTDDAKLGCPGSTNHCEGKKQYGSGCNGANGNRDCSVATGETCARVFHCSGATNLFCNTASDCPGGQTCDAPSGSTSSQIAIPKAEAQVTKNDANLIVKVRPDRECAQWLACSSYEQVFDSQENKFKPRCTAFTLCEGTTNPAANNLECSATLQPPAKVFGEEDYVKRDVTYSGLEYAGYSVPARYPAQYLSPVSIIGGRCWPITGSPGAFKSCKNTADCNPATEYCKQLTGVCKNDKQGQACDTNADCGNGYCSKSYFDTYRFGVLLDPSSNCASDDECDGLDGCSATQINAALTATSAAAVYADSSHCTRTKFTDDGACIQHRCYYNYSGGPFNTADASFRAQCRAYPEGDAPYTDQVVDKLQSIGKDGFDAITWQAVAKKSGYQGVNTCTYENDCECSYRRLDYGKGGGAVRYVSLNGALLPQSTAAIDASGVVPKQSFSSSLGVCVGGSRDGYVCSSATDCKVSTDDLGTCTKLTKVSTVLGWPGFCIDYDKSLSINGDPNQFNCNLWMPVDQLAGAPDNFNQFREAGYKPPIDNLLYCAVAEGTKRSGAYYQIADDFEGGPPSPCVTAGAGDGGCAAFTDQAGCEGGTARNNIGSPWNGIGLGISNKPSCWWDSGVCKARVNLDGPFYCTDFKTDSDDCKPPGWDSIFGAGSYYGNWHNMGACEKFGVAVADAVCTGATLAVVAANPAYALGPAAATGATCFALFEGYCAESGFKTCNGALLGSPTGEFFHTSWQDATAAYTLFSAGNKNDILASVVEFNSTHDTAGTVTAKMVMNAQNNWEADFNFDENCDNGLCNQTPGGHDHNPAGNNGTCINMINLAKQGQSYEGACEGMGTACVGSQLDFNPDGTVKGIWTVLCHNPSTIWHRVSSRIAFLYREACTEVIEANDSTSEDTPNFAWTNKLFNAKNGTPIPGLAGFNYSVTTTRPNADPTTLEPYGPITPSMGASSLGSLAWPIPPYPPGGGSPFTAFSVGGIIDSSHAPPCDSSENPADLTASNVYTKYCDNGYTFAAGDPGSPAPNPAAYPPPAEQHFTAAGYPFACTGDCAGPNPNKGAGAEAVARGLMGKFFVQTMGLYTYTPGTVGPTYVKSRDWAYDDRQLYATYDSQPKIVAPNSGGACDPANDGLCPEDPWNASTNGSFQVSGVDATPSTSSSDVETAAGGRATVYFKYYAYADSDHMPLRRKMVDFGDGTTPSITPGWFKNHRGCNGTPCSTSSHQICGSVATDWGLQPQACESRYFQDVHTYTCTPQMLATLHSCTGSTTYPCQDGTACVFRPRIQFLDNWGVCNGQCPGGVGAAKMCFNSDHDLNLLIPTHDPTTGPSRNECIGLESTGVLDNYKVTIGGDTLTPWTLGPTIRIQP